MSASSLYPTALTELDAWRKQAGTTLDEARKRFAQFVVLECISAGSVLHATLAFKGGNALRFVYGNPRSTLDLDFTASSTFPDDENAVRTHLDTAFAQARRFGIKMKAQKVKRNPKRRDATLPTFQISVGYQLPGDRYFGDFEQPSRSVPTVVDVEISLNDIVCETRNQALRSSQTNLRVCSLEDILAEKLRALLQQVIRDRTRPQDVFDIAQVIKDHPNTLDYSKIGIYFVQKCTARLIEPRKAAFADPQVKIRASTGYGELTSETTVAIIPFLDAWRAVLELVESLEIPE